MNVLIIYAHPNPNSFNHAALEQLKLGFKEGNHKVQVIDLYRDNFNPVLFFDDLHPRSEQVNTPDLKEYQSNIKEAQHLVFLYPVWWYSMPAILKGFIDKVFVPGFAYSKKGKLPKGLLQGKTAWVVYTIDSPEWFVKLFRKSIEWSLMKTAILKYCGISSVQRIMYANATNSTPQKRKKWLGYIYDKARNFKPNAMKKGDHVS